MSISDWLQRLCTRSGYCLAYSELEEATLSFIFASFFAATFGNMIFDKQLDGRNHELAKLKDDMFDIVLLRIYGIIMLILVAATWKWQHETVQTDVLVFEIVLALTALAVNNNKVGLCFVALSYSSWYGWFRLLMVTPLGSDFDLLVRPQWIAALLAYTAPMLISNLKYPTLLDAGVARLAYGLALFGAILAAHAGLVWFDIIVTSNDLIPSHAEGVMSGSYFRMYGASITPLTRVCYIAAMSALQCITCMVPHYLVNKEDLRKQLLEQQLGGADEDPDFAPSSKPSHSANPNVHNQSTSSDIFGSVGGEQTGTDGIDLTDIPGDCIEISAEAAIDMQERSIRAREAREAETARATSVIIQRKKAAAAE